MSLEDLIKKEVERLGLTETELKNVLRNLRGANPRKYKPRKIRTRKKVKFGIISDLHIGHECYRPDILSHASQKFEEEGIEFIINAGDTIEGMSGREGHIYELTHIGYSAQMDYFEEEFKKLAKWKVYSIEADKSHSGWYRSKANMGVDIGEELHRRAPNYIFLGYDEQDLILKSGKNDQNVLRIRIRHPGGGTAYAISYKMQKYIESLSGGDKPHIVIQGHFHKANYMFLRNIHCFDAGTLQEQSPYMKKKGTPAHLGYWIVEVTYSRAGIEEIIPKFIPFYD